MTAPSNIPVFVPGGESGIAPAHAEAGITPLEYIRAHPATKPWYAQYSQVALGASANNVALDLDPGFEGIIHYVSFLGDSGLHGGGQGITFWNIFVDRVPVMKSRLMINSNGNDTGDGALNTLPEQDGLGNSWGTLDIWVPDDGLVEVIVTPGAAYTNGLIGWIMYGWYWPITVRENWHQKGWDVIPRRAVRTLRRGRRL